MLTTAFKYTVGPLWFPATSSPWSGGSPGGATPVRRAERTLVGTSGRWRAGVRSPRLLGLRTECPGRHDEGLVVQVTGGTGRPSPGFRHGPDVLGLLLAPAPSAIGDVAVGSSNRGRRCSFGRSSLG